MTNNKNVHTFYELINNAQILIPNIQRDYAQGRTKYNKNGLEITSEKPYQIRISLVNTLYDGIDGKIKKDLNFVYGKNEIREDKNVFIPIDGQQRLTTLFLLHWYVYQRANQTEELEKLGNSFSYETRDTTKNFCGEICKKVILSDEDTPRLAKLISEKAENKKFYRLSTIIIDKIWFTSGYANDPSVKSMLTMIDTIEEKFARSEGYNCQSDFEAVSELLRGNECPITFSFLDVNDFDDEDMYIKMNARGKELTNFEIFKARLEEGDVLEGVCYAFDDAQSEKSKKKAEYIGKYNNEFTNLFYGIDEIGKSAYDLAFFHFVECIIKCDHYAQLVGYTGISEGDYRNDFSNTTYTGASLFNDYILNPVLHDYKGDKVAEYVDILKARTKDSLNKMTGILDFLVKKGFDVLPDYKNDMESNNTTYNEKKLFIKNAEGKKNNIDLVTQYALFSYLYVFDCIVDFENKKDAYREWKRFVCNITFDLALKDQANFPKLVAIFDAMLLDIKKKCQNANKTPDTTVILETIRDYKDIKAVKNIPKDVIKHLFENEAYKAKLMLDDSLGAEWSEVIREAENYFEDGDIGFLFETIEGNETPTEFKAAFDRLIKWIKKNKEPQNETLLNEALLCMGYPSEQEETAHMKIYNIDSSWQLYCGRQASLRNALSCKYDEKEDAAHVGLIKLIRSYDSNMTVEDYTESLIATYQDINGCWLRNTLVKERLVKKLIEHKDLWNFSGTIGRISPTVQDEYVLFYSTAYNSLNIELNLFRLAMNLIDKHPDLSMNIISGKTRGRAVRYIELNGKQVGYDVNCRMFYNISSQSYLKPVNNDMGMSEAIEYLEE